MYHRFHKNMWKQQQSFLKDHVTLKKKKNCFDQRNKLHFTKYSNININIFSSLKKMQLW